MVSRAKLDGGLGIIDLKSQNEALLLKHLHKFFNKADVPWVHLIWEKYYSNGKLPNHTKKGSFWWHDILKLLDKFKGLASAVIGNGASCLHWDDCWNGQSLKLEFPKLHSFVGRPATTLEKARLTNEISSLSLSLSLSLPSTAF